MTERLYYDDAYLLDFDAVCVKTKEDADRYLIALDRSAFYPTSGGQPYDRGTLNGIEVTDVFTDEAGVVWHAAAQAIPEGTPVKGSIDAGRRTDHMQQHAADHMIAGTLFELYHATTIGLHIGDEVSSIDVAFEDGTTRLDREAIERVEDIVNARVRQNLPIRCWFPDTEEIGRLPLRKAPTVREHIRIVAIGDFEMVACGGTHPAHTGEIGLIKILDITPARGKARVTFVAGGRAFENYRKCFEVVRETGCVLTTSPERIADSVRNLKQRLKTVEAELIVFKREQLSNILENMTNNCKLRSDGVKLVMKMFETDRSLLKDAASKLVKRDGIIALLGAKDDKGFCYVFACSRDVEADMGTLLRTAGGKGGGTKDFAQGSASEDILDIAYKMIDHE